MEHATAAVRRFLVETFGDEDLKTFCFDYFRDVYDDFAAGMTKGQMIQLLIERCVRREALPNLEAALRAERPAQYERRVGAPAPAAVPAEIAPAGRDSRQVFISHAHQDADFAHRLAADLEKAGWRAWIAPDSIGPGEKWVEAIGRGLDGSGVFVVVLTPAAVGSSWVKTETNAAIALDNRGEVQFIPLEVAACSPPVLWNVYQSVSFRNRYEDGLWALLGRLGTVAGDGETRRREGETRRQGDKETRQEIEVAAAALRLSGPQVQELRDALLDAYDENSLRQMVRFQLDEHLDLIAGGGNLSQVVFNLIAWAERTGRIEALIGKAQAANPGNARLAACARSVPSVPVVAAAEVVRQMPPEMPSDAVPQPTPASERAPSRRAAALRRAARAAGPIDFDWVTIPAGEFLMGSEKQGFLDRLFFGDERPQHRLHLPEYRIARVPVTVAQFGAFLNATSQKAGTSLDMQKKPDHPVMNIWWHEAVAFCKWANVRLPTEAEWEKAARGTDGRIWPWGNNEPTNELCNFGSSVGDTTPVGRYPGGASPYGVLDMAGNAWEWTSSLPKSYPYDAKDGREDPDATGNRVLRGGSFRDGARSVRCACRYGFWLVRNIRVDNIGFRVVSPGF